MPKYIGGKKQKLYCGGVKIRKQYCEQKKIYSSGNFVYYNVDDKVYSEEFDEGLSILNPSSFFPTKTGWEFVGWRSDTVASASVISSLVMGDDAITLYAVFRQSVVVNYYNDSTTPKTDTKYRYYNSGNVVNPTFKLSQASKSGWSARGWSTGTNANSDITYANNAEFQRDTGITLYGMYYQNITVTYYNNSSYASNSVGTRYYNSNGNIINPRFTLSQATRSGWTSVGWSTSNTATGAIVYDDGVEFARDSNITLYGRYNQIVSVTYYNNSTTAKTTSGTRYYNSIGNVSNPKFTLTQSAKSGWTARGWSTGTSGNAAITYENGSEFARESSITLYGMYYKTVTLYYNGNGAITGSMNSDSKTAYYNSNENTVNPTFTLASNAFGLPGYHFVGWSTTASATSGASAGTTVTLSSSVTYFAIWKISAVSMLSTTYFTPSDYVTVSGSNLKVDKGANTSEHEMAVYSAYASSEFTSLQIAGNYYISSKSSTPTRFRVTLENSSGAELAELLKETVENGGSENPTVGRNGTFSKTVDISGISSAFRVKIYMYERYTDEGDNYINFTKMTLS